VAHEPTQFVGIVTACPKAATDPTNTASTALTFESNTTLLIHPSIRKASFSKSCHSEPNAKIPVNDYQFRPLPKSVILSGDARFCASQSKDPEGLNSPQPFRPFNHNSPEPSLQFL
jgi:hypothetical protein